MIIVPASVYHIQSIADRMRQADRDEVMACSGSTPYEALAMSLGKSSHAWTLMIDGMPEVMCGVGDLNVLSRVAAPWLLGTDAVLNHKRWFLENSKDWRNQLLTKYSLLTNLVDVRNKLSVRWLKWLGAEFDDPVMIGEYEFMIFKMRAGNV